MSNTYDIGEQRIGRGLVDLEGADIRLVIVDSTYVFSASHADLDAITGQIDTSPTMAGRAVNGKVWSGTDVTILSMTGATPAGAVVVEWGATNAEIYPIVFLDGNQPYPATDGTDYTFEIGDIITRP